MLEPKILIEQGEYTLFEYNGHRYLTKDVSLLDMLYLTTVIEHDRNKCIVSRFGEIYTSFEWLVGSFIDNDLCHTDKFLGKRYFVLDKRAIYESEKLNHHDTNVMFYKIVHGDALRSESF